MLENLSFSFAEIFTNVFAWFTDLMTTSTMLQLFLSMFTIYCCYRFLLKPLFDGGAGSDQVKKGKSKKGK